MTLDYLERVSQSMSFEGVNAGQELYKIILKKNMKTLLNIILLR